MYIDYSTLNFCVLFSLSHSSLPETMLKYKQNIWYKIFFKGNFPIPLFKKTLKVIHTCSKYLIFNASSFQWLIICTLLDLFTDYLPNTNIQTSCKYLSHWLLLTVWLGGYYLFIVRKQRPGMDKVIKAHSTWWKNSIDGHVPSHYTMLCLTLLTSQITGQ